MPGRTAKARHIRTRYLLVLYLRRPSLVRIGPKMSQQKNARRGGGTTGETLRSSSSSSCCRSNPPRREANKVLLNAEPGAFHVDGHGQVLFQLLLVGVHGQVYAVEARVRPARGGREGGKCLGIKK